VAIIKSPKPIARGMMSEMIADLGARGSRVVMDDDVEQDIADGIEAYRRSRNPPSWE